MNICLTFTNRKIVTPFDIHKGGNGVNVILLDSTPFNSHFNTVLSSNLRNAHCLVLKNFSDLK